MPRKSEKAVDAEDHSEDSDDQSEDLADEEIPPAIEPYSVLGLEKTATEDEIKRAYRMTALKHHPDKVSEDLKEEATKKFQEIAFAYAVLSDPVRRKRYDATGSTSESLEADNDFSWADFYREQFRDVITPDAIEKFEASYKNSEEEKRDLLAAFEEHEGSMSAVFETVMLSNPLEDEERFKVIIDEAIEKKEVTAWKAYTNETKKQKAARKKEARSEAKEAEEMAKKLGVHDKLKKGKKGTGEDALAALIKAKQADRGKSFLDRLEEKYAGEQKSMKGRGKRRVHDEDEEDDTDMPSEEAFQAIQAKLKKAKANKTNAEEAEPKRRRGKKRVLDEDEDEAEDEILPSLEVIRDAQAKAKKAKAKKAEGTKAEGSRKSKRAKH